MSTHMSVHMPTPMPACMFTRMSIDMSIDMSIHMQAQQFLRVFGGDDPGRPKIKSYNRSIMKQVVITI